MTHQRCSVQHLHPLEAPVRVRPIGCLVLVFGCFGHQNRVMNDESKSTIAHDSAAGGASSLVGLSEREAKARRLRYGKNELRARPLPGFCALFLRQFKNPFMGILIAAGGLTWFLGALDQAIILEMVVVVNALIGTFMEHRAARTLAQLGGCLSLQARIRRQGDTRLRRATEVVPDDLVELESGDRIPADGWLVTGDLLVDESLLTGESVGISKSSLGANDVPEPSEKMRTLYAGSTVQAGCGVMRVQSIGYSTALGRIGTLLETQPTATSPIQRQMAHLGQALTVVITAIAIVLFALGLMQGRETWPLLQTVVILAVAAIPEGLPAVATVALATGALRMAQAGLWVRQLSVVGALGQVTTVCLDKTGTLTCNEMTACEWWTPSGRYRVSGVGWQTAGRFVRLDDPGHALVVAQKPDLRRVLEVGAWCNLAQVQGEGSKLEPRGDAVDVALLVAAIKAGIGRIQDVPDSHTMAVPQAGKPWMMIKQGDLCLIKGRVSSVLERCTLCWMPDGARAWRPGEAASWLEANRLMAEEGLRVLGLGEEAPDGQWIWLGLVGLADPLREDAIASTLALHRLGLKLVMLTGDQDVTAQAIARQLQERSSATDAETIPWAIHSQVDPQDKWHIIRQHQAAHEVVLMIGDGVNDAPALKEADVGIAIWGGHTVAAEAALAVLTRPSLLTIADAVAIGRTTLARVECAIDYLLSCSFTTLMVVATASVLNLPLPLNPMQILYLNVLTHGILALGLVFERGSSLRPKPVETRLTWLSRRRGTILWIHCGTMASITLGAQYVDVLLWGWVHAQTFAFVTLASVLTCHLMVDRSERPWAGWRTAIEPGLLVCLLSAACLQAAALGVPRLAQYLELHPLHWQEAVLIISASLLATGLGEWTKRKHSTETR